MQQRRHSRAGGNPESFTPAQPRDFENEEPDSRFLFRHSRAGGNPESFTPAKPHDFETDELDSRFRGNDGGGGLRRNGWGGILRGNGAEDGASTSRARPSPPGQTYSRHSRAGGNPESFSPAKPRDFENEGLDSRLLFRHSRAGGNPESFSPAQPHDFKNDELDSRFRGNDGGGGAGMTGTGCAGMVGTGVFVGLAWSTAQAHAECAP